jgi:hypothetical protein
MTLAGGGGRHRNGELRLSFDSAKATYSIMLSLEWFDDMMTGVCSLQFNMRKS